MKDDERVLLARKLAAFRDHKDILGEELTESRVALGGDAPDVMCAEPTAAGDPMSPPGRKRARPEDGTDHPPEGSRKKRAKRKFDRACDHCSTHFTSQWRKGPAGASTYVICVHGTRRCVFIFGLIG